jgi:hypothetical protein
MTVGDQADRPQWRERSRSVRWWRLWRTRRPTTFNEKVRYKMLRDHRQLIVTFADKVAVRSYISAVVGERYLPALFYVSADPETFREADLPASYVLKPTHGSGAVVVVSADAPADARLPSPSEGWVYRHVRPDAVNRAELVALCASWLAQLHGQGPNREWAYGFVPRAVIVEEFLTGPGPTIPDDYKLFVFHGQCRFIQVDGGRFGKRTQDFFQPDWHHVPMSGGPPWAATPVPRPPRLEEMIDVAQRLGRDTDFVRVDLYALPERIVVGELTNYPAGGNSPFEPETFNTEFGRYWTVSKHYRPASTDHDGEHRA